MSQQPPVEFERMRPGQIRTCRELADIAFLPLGALEWHGLQAPVGTDGLKSHDICCRAARRLGGGAVFPPVYHGLPGDIGVFIQTQRLEIFVLTHKFRRGIRQKIEKAFKVVSTQGAL